MRERCSVAKDWQRRKTIYQVHGKDFHGRLFTKDLCERCPLARDLQRLKQNKGNLESINKVVFEDHVDFSVSNISQRIHFMNACIDTPSVYSCAADYFLEICFRLFVKDLHDISPDRRSNIFEAVVGAIDIYEVVIISSDTNLLSQLRQPIWDYIVSNFSSFVLKNCDAEFSQIFPGNIFNSLSSEEQILFETLYNLEGTSQPAITCSKLTIETLEQGVKYVQS